MYSLVDVYRRLRGVCRLHHRVIGLTMEEECASETSVNVYQITRRNISELPEMKEHQCQRSIQNALNASVKINCFLSERPLMFDVA